MTLINTWTKHIICLVTLTYFLIQPISTSAVYSSDKSMESLFNQLTKVDSKIKKIRSNSTFFKKSKSQILPDISNTKLNKHLNPSALTNRLLQVTQIKLKGPIVKTDLFQTRNYNIQGTDMSSNKVFIIIYKSSIEFYDFGGHHLKTHKFGIFSKKNPKKNRL